MALKEVLPFSNKIITHFPRTILISDLKARKPRPREQQSLTHGHTVSQRAPPFLPLRHVAEPKGSTFASREPGFPYLCLANQELCQGETLGRALLASGPMMLRFIYASV